MNKYHAIKTPYGGRTYDSKAESQYAMQLDLQLRAGKILGWKPQPKFVLADVISYRADFLVWDEMEMWAVDVKGVETQRFKMASQLWRKYGPIRLVVIGREGPRHVIAPGFPKGESHESDADI